MNDDPKSPVASIQRPLETTLRSALALVIFLTLLFVPTVVSAQSPASTVSATPTLLEKELELVKQQYEFLKGEAQHYEDRVDRERTQFYTFIGVVFAVTSAFGIGSYIALFVRINSMAKTKLEEVVASKSKQLKKDAETWARSVVDQAFGFEKNIVILAPKKNQQEVKTKLLPALKRRGFKHVAVQVPDSDVQNFDLVIFYLNDTLKKELEDLVDSLISADTKTPVIAYSTNQTHCDKFKSYEWGTFANSPLTLASWAFTILSSSSVERKT